MNLPVTSAELRRSKAFAAAVRSRRRHLPPPADAYLAEAAGDGPGFEARQSQATGDKVSE
ncbi:hypothetical protein [Methylobacterium sp. A54F]